MLARNIVARLIAHGCLSARGVAITCSPRDHASTRGALWWRLGRAHWDGLKVDDGEVAGARACRFSGGEVEVAVAGAGSFCPEVEVAIPLEVAIPCAEGFCRKASQRQARSPLAAGVLTAVLRLRLDDPR
jgi:hypothetical protein